MLKKLDKATAENKATSAEVAGILVRKNIVSRHVKDVHEEAARTGKVKVPGTSGLFDRASGKTLR